MGQHRRAIVHFTDNLRKEREKQKQKETNEQKQQQKPFFKPKTNSNNEHDFAKAANKLYKHFNTQCKGEKDETINKLGTKAAQLKHVKCFIIANIDAKSIFQFLKDIITDERILSKMDFPRKKKA